ncbi:hypothetical protein JB92DRAFT_3102236 [Gautieria morchelliformis]|nr:hypothetical protein JB92DRAFT_3102236 [Gautieria morchelliformis]
MRAAAWLMSSCAWRLSETLGRPLHSEGIPGMVDLENLRELALLLDRVVSAEVSPHDRDVGDGHQPVAPGPLLGYVVRTRMCGEVLDELREEEERGARGACGRGWGTGNSREWGDPASQALRGAGGEERREDERVRAVRERMRAVPTRLPRTAGEHDRLDVYYPRLEGGELREEGLHVLPYAVLDPERKGILLPRELHDADRRHGRREGQVEER